MFSKVINIHDFLIAFLMSETLLKGGILLNEFFVEEKYYYVLLSFRDEIRKKNAQLQAQTEREGLLKLH